MKNLRNLHGVHMGLCLLLVFLLSACNLPIDEIIGGETPTSSPSPTQITLPTPSTGMISGLVWHDLCAVPGEGVAMPEAPPSGCVAIEGGGFRANGIYEQDEPGIEGIEISLGMGQCPSSGFATAMTDAAGRFGFSDLTSGIYCLFLDPSHPRNSQILIPGVWTAGNPEASGVIRTTVNVVGGEDAKTFEFGWDHQFLPAYETPPTETPQPTETIAITETGQPTETATPEEVPSSTPTPEGTPSAQDPDLPAGDPAWRDSFDSGGNWPLYDDEHVKFEVTGGKAVMTAINPDLYEGWMLSWPEINDFYLEGTFKTGTCSGRDRYGLMTRSTAPSEAYVGYLYGVTCHGQYALRIWDGEEFTQLIGWTSSDLIESGTGKTNRLGFWANGNRIILFVNGQKLTEIQDSAYSSGKFGLFIGSADTNNFKVEVDQVAYWNLD